MKFFQIKSQQQVNKKSNLQSKICSLYLEKYKQMIILISALLNVVNSFVGDQTCLSKVTPSTCQNLGYCYWDGSTCQVEDCYKIDEIAACRASGVLHSPIICNALELDGYFFQIYANVCNDPSEDSNELVQHYIRYQEPKNGYADKSSDGVTLNIWNTLFPQYGYISQIYTIQILKQNMVQLDQTLDIYIKYQSLLLYDTNWTYEQEKSISYMLQQLRDDTTLVNTNKKPMITKVWQIIDNLLERFRIIGNNYTAIYPLYSISQVSLSRLQAELSGRKHLAAFKWNQYLQNGYVQILGYDIHQFGFVGQLTQVYEINVFDSGHNTQSLTYGITFTFPFDVTAIAPIYLYSFNKATLQETQIRMLTIGPTDECSYDSTALKSKCNIYPITGNTQYFIGTALNTCLSIPKRYLCKQPRCLWTGSSCTDNPP
ncbi:unnamed protein product [Paramecium sonneborni]|uniref:Uncharacterized protein n=1 Tax=Paramecium sonneborni TaxID=65129 RepID=A0A8S1REK0_9CILI|nr:unnamed protein product [Paramecium sonneborni]